VRNDCKLVRDVLRLVFGIEIVGETLKAENSGSLIFIENIVM
jgi:hypothetical protein